LVAGRQSLCVPLAAVIESAVAAGLSGRVGPTIDNVFIL
jgi:hypothetical protein